MATNEELTEARLRAVSAETDTKIARLEGKIDALGASLIGELRTLAVRMESNHEYDKSTRWVIIGLAVALAGLVVGMATYGDALFGRGMNVRDVIQSTIKDYDAGKRPQQPAN